MNVQKIGPVVHNRYLYHYDFVWVEGKPAIVTVVNGNPAILAVVDAETYEQLDTYTLENADGAMNLLCTRDGRIIAGTFTQGAIYLIDLNRKVKTKLACSAAGLRFIYGLCLIEDDLYFGGFKGCTLSKYNLPAGEIETVAEIDPAEMYLRYIYPIGRKLIIGCGSHAQLYEYDLDKNQLRKFKLGSLEGKSGFVAHIDHVKNHIVAAIEAQNAVFVCDPISRQIITQFDGFSRFMVAENELYLFNENGTFRYNWDLERVESFSNEFTVGWKTMKALVTDQGVFLTRMTRNGEFSKLDIRTKQMTTIQLPLPATAALIQTIHEAPTGKIYINGYQSGGLSVYNPHTGSIVEHKGIEQTEGMAFTADKAYFGEYPGATIYEWNYEVEDHSEAAPKRLFQIGERQDRPFAMTTDGERLYIGTVPDYGESGGALTVYEIQERRHTTFRHLVKDQSITALALDPNHPRYLYGGTSIWGGLGHMPTEQEAKLFVWDSEEQRKVEEWVPLAGEDGIGALSFDAKGRLWGMTRGTLFTVDPANLNVERKKILAKMDSTGHFWRGPFMRFLQDGSIVINVNQTICLMNPDTLEETKLCERAHLLAVSEQANKIYFVRERNLFSIPIRPSIGE